jgi:acetolactate synthase-1/2/3 large subunit
VECAGALAITTASGRGTISDDHPRTICGDYGGWGVELVNELIRESDLVLALGCKLTHNGSGGFGIHLPTEKLVRLDTSAEVLSAGYPAALAVVADARQALPRLLEIVRAARNTGSGWTEEECAAWRARFDTARASSVLHQADLPDWPGHTVADFFRALRRVMPRMSHLVTDSGQHQIWTRQHYPVWSPQGLLLPTDFQSMGFALPVAMGAKLAHPDVPVVAIVGDGGFLMSGLSLVTAVQERIPLTVVVFNDGALSQIQYQQWREFGRDFATTPGSISFSAFAASLGIDYAVLGPDLEAALSSSLSTDRVTLLELRLRPGASVAAGAIMARAKGAVRRGPGGALLQSLWRRLKPPR